MGSKRVIWLLVMTIYCPCVGCITLITKDRGDSFDLNQYGIDIQENQLNFGVSVLGTEGEVRMNLKRPDKNLQYKIHYSFYSNDGIEILLKDSNNRHMGKQVFAVLNSCLFNCMLLFQLNLNRTHLTLAKIEEERNQTIHFNDDDNSPEDVQLVSIKSWYTDAEWTFSTQDILKSSSEPSTGIEVSSTTANPTITNTTEKDTKPLIHTDTTYASINDALSISDTVATSLPDTGTTSISNTDTTHASVNNSVSLLNIIATSIMDTNPTSVSDTPTTSIPDTGTTFISNTDTTHTLINNSVSLLNIIATSIMDTNPTSVSDTPTTSIPDLNTAPISDTAATSISDTLTTSIPDFDTTPISDTAAKSISDIVATSATTSTLTEVTPLCLSIDEMQNITLKELQEIITQLRSQLIVNKTNLSSFIRARNCADDTRPSATVIGYVGTVVIISLIVTIVMIDLAHFCRFLKNIIPF